MWQAPNQRSKAQASMRRRERERNRKPMHIKRVEGQIRIMKSPSQSVVSEARIVLNDISPKGLGFFSSEPMLPGQLVAITVNDPRRLYVQGRICWCQEYNVDSKVLSQKSYTYRVGIKFVFDTEEEKRDLEAYCRELAQTQLYGEAS